MVLTYLPLNLMKCCNKYNLPHSNTLNNDIYNIFKEFYEKSFCNFELIKGKNKNSLCGNKIRDNNIYCRRHIKYINYNGNNITNFQCIAKSRRRDRCGRLVKKEGDYCFIHNKEKTIKIQKIFKLRIIFLIKFLYIYYTSRKKNKNILDLNVFKNINCINLIKLLNIEYKIEGSTFRIQNNNFNIVISNNLFIDNKSGKGGKGILELYLYITKKDIKSFIKFIKEKEKNIFISFPTSNNTNNNKFSMTNKKIKLKNSLVIEEKQNINNIKKYLIIKRKLNEDLINKLINNNIISSDINNNCIFYNKNKTYAHLRGTSTKRFFCSIGKSDFIQYKTDDNPLYLFESPIDMLSYVTLNSYSKGNMISLSGEMMVNNVHKLINEYIKDVYLCFDNDEKGDEFCSRIKELLKYYKIKFKRLKPINKDWNEDLTKTNKN